MYNRSQVRARMEGSSLHVILIAVLLVLLVTRLFMKKKPENLPPTPPALPIIGHLHLLKHPIHRTLLNLSQKYGHIFALRFGNRLAIVVSSPSAVEECLSANDIVFANRPSYSMPKYTDYNQTTLGTASYGDHWRKLRRISTVEVLSSRRLREFQSVREDEVSLLLNRLYEIACHGFSKVELRPLFFSLTTNVIMRMIAGKRYYNIEDVNGTEEAKQFQEILEEYLELTKMTNLGDLIPVLQWLSFGSVNKFMKLGRRIDSFLQGLVEEHKIDRDRNTMINHLLALQEVEPECYSDEIIKGLILSMMIASTETSTVTLEWAMANLLNHPSVLEKAKAEIDAKIGGDRLIEESDLPNLTYLQSIIYESMRITPPIPLLPPHSSSQDCTIGGYHVPANTMLLVNIWAIHTDPDLWEDPMSFKPERFENGKPGEFNFMQFGLGRRACPGEKLATKEIGLTLGSMIQCFEWKRLGEKEIDMNAKTTVVMSRVEPLEAMCKARPILHKILSQAIPKN